MFRVFRRKADAARPARKQSFAQRGGWNLNVGCPAMTSTGYMTALGRNPTSRPITPSTCWQDAPPRSAQQTRRPRQAGQAGYQGEALAHWQPGLQLVVRVAALIHQQAHPQQHCQAQQAANWRPAGDVYVHAGSGASASAALAGASAASPRAEGEHMTLPFHFWPHGLARAARHQPSAPGLGLILLLFQ